ncbi:MAG: pyridoxamine 5'-phosphate oxidase family protein [Actinomycetota bacterium]|nr:pyridoxamine 5'-phosphate oxidase family protein [Actinomycetota bacterium]
MSLSDKDLEYLKTNQSAAMITVGGDGRPKVARVAVTLVNGKLWSSGTADRARTKRLRRDPRCTLFVFDSGWSWLTLESTVRLLEGPDAADLSLTLFRTMQDRPSGDISWFGKDIGEESFLKLMADEGRLVYEFEVERTYGMH